MSRQSRIHLNAAHKNSGKRRPLKPTPIQMLTNAISKMMATMQLPAIKSPTEKDE